MYRIGDVVVYGTEGICTVIGTTEKKFDGLTIEYYVLSPVSKEANTVFAPMDNEKIMSKMRPILTKDEAEIIINNLPCEPLPWVENERARQQKYKEVLLYGKPMDIFMMTRSLYIKQEEQIQKGKKLHAADERFLREAERMIFDELAYAFKIKPNEVLPMIINLYKEI